MGFKVYLAGAMSGLHWKEIKRRFFDVRDKLEEIGFFVITPLLGKEDAFDDDIILGKHGYDNSPLTKESSIVNRDFWMVDNSDILFVNLTGVDMVSIGSVCEITRAYTHGKYVVIVMEEDNIHSHAFLSQMATIFTSEEEALNYMKKWSHLMKRTKYSKRFLIF